MNVPFKRAAVLGVLCLGLATAAAAQPSGRMPGQPDPAREAQHQKMFEEMRMKREQRLHDLLQIRPEQENAFRAFLASMMPPHKPGEGRPGERGPRGAGGPGGERPEMTTPQRLDRMSARIAQMQQKIAATKTFYAALSPEQKKAFDALPPMHGHRGFGGGHGRFGGRDEHEDHGFGGPPPPR